MRSRIEFRRFVTVLFGWLVALAVAGPSQATETGQRIETREERRAMALLDRAVKHVESNGAAAVVAFTREPDFIDHDLYVYALHADGRFLASGGSSAALIGTNVKDQLDLAGRPFFREMIEIARRDGAGTIEYNWFNPADSRGGPKLARFRMIGDVIVSVGFFPPRATPFEARKLLNEAATALQQDAAAALLEFQHRDGPFVRNDLYVFVVRVTDGRFLAHGASPELVGTDAYALQDPNGRRVVAEMLGVASLRGEGELSYAWRNPTLDRIENKNTFFRVVDGMLIGVGHYVR